MANYKEIVTKAVVGKCKKNIISEYEFSPSTVPDTILGCWIINHRFTGSLSGNKATLNGSFDVNVWYSYDNDTKTGVFTQNFNYSDVINLNLKEVASNQELIINCLKQPTVNDVKIKNGVVYLKVDKNLGVEVIGNVNVKIAVEDDFDDYEEVFDTPNEEELNINIDNINENYLEDAVNK